MLTMTLQPGDHRRSSTPHTLQLSGQPPGSSCPGGRRAPGSPRGRSNPRCYPWLAACPPPVSPPVSSQNPWCGWQWLAMARNGLRTALLVGSGTGDQQLTIAVQMRLQPQPQPSQFLSPFSFLLSLCILPHCFYCFHVALILIGRHSLTPHLTGLGAAGRSQASRRPWLCLRHGSDAMHPPLHASHIQAAAVVVLTRGPVELFPEAEIRLRC